MAKASTAKRDNGFSVYPDAVTLATIDKFAADQERKRSPMALLLIKKGIEAMKKAKSNA